MHSVEIRKEIVDRVLARRGRYHLFDSLDPERTALVVIDMQATFVEPGSPAEVPTSRGIVEPINALSAELRKLGVTIVWVNHANAHNSKASDWEMFFNHFVANDSHVMFDAPFHPCKNDRPIRLDEEQKENIIMHELPIGLIGTGRIGRLHARHLSQQIAGATEAGRAA